MGIYIYMGKEDSVFGWLSHSEKGSWLYLIMSTEAKWRREGVGSHIEEHFHENDHDICKFAKLHYITSCIGLLSIIVLESSYPW